MNPDYLAIQLMIEYAKSYTGTLYQWGTVAGGDDPTGFDCSGFVCECLQSIGVLPHRMRVSADRLFAYLSAKGHAPRGEDEQEAGDIQFLLDRDSGKAQHVNLLIESGYVIGAIGGDSHTLTEQDAATQNAFVKIRPINYFGTRLKAVYLQV